LWDIIGRAKNMPTYQIWAAGNKPQPHVHVYASAGNEYRWDTRREDLIDEALGFKEEGFTGYKFRPGQNWNTVGMTMEKYIPWVRKLRDAVGPKFDLMQEADGRWNLEQALQICPVMEELKFVWLEAPVNEWAEGAIDKFLTLKEKLPTVLLCGGDVFNTRHQFKPWIDRGAMDIVQPDCTVAGPTEAWHVARMAQMRKIYCDSHNWFGGLAIMANSAMAAAIPNALVMEVNMGYNPLKTEIFKDPLVIKKSYIDLPKKPGFGLEIIPDVEKKFPFIPAPPRPARA
jgi:L-alanine-DL-glutamate epimerase-like enolase superfamily enzyme